MMHKQTPQAHVPHVTEAQEESDMDRFLTGLLDPGEGYWFPYMPLRAFEDATQEELLGYLEGLAAEGFERCGSKNIPTRYADIRVALCQVSLELNLRQTIAPRFRNLPAPPRKAVAPNEVDFALDLQMIDLHWRAHSKRKPSLPISGYDGLFSNAPFNFSVAREFALRTLPKDMKVLDARLTETMTVEHAVLQTTAQSDKWRLIRKGFVRGAQVERLGIPHVRAHLEESVISQPHLAPHVPGWVDVWAACRLVGEKPARVSAMIGLMTGTEPADVSATKRKIVAVKKRLAHLD